jgi:hypothetical protein
VSGIQGNEGVVIEKKIKGYHALYQLNNETYFLLQSNYDRDQVDPSTDSRRTPVEKRIENIGQGMDP